MIAIGWLFIIVPFTFSFGFLLSSFFMDIERAEVESLREELNRLHAYQYNFSQWSSSTPIQEKDANS